MSASPLQPTYSGADVGPQSTLSMIMQGYAPQARASTSALNNQLASMGIQGGSALDAQSALQSQLAAGLAPSLAQAVQGSQGMTLEQSLANMQAANQSKSALAQMLYGGWGQGLSQFGALNQAGLGTAGSLAGQEANNYQVYQQNPIFGQMLGAAGMALGGPMGASLGQMLGSGLGGQTSTAMPTADFAYQLPQGMNTNLGYN